MKKLTIEQARDAARAFIASITSPDRQWTIETAEAHTPRGWTLNNRVEECDFFPVTVKNVSRIYRAHCELAE